MIGMQGFTDLAFLAVSSEPFTSAAMTIHSIFGKRAQ